MGAPFEPFGDRFLTPFSKLAPFLRAQPGSVAVATMEVPVSVSICLAVYDFASVRYLVCQSAKKTGLQLRQQRHEFAKICKSLLLLCL